MAEELYVKDRVRLFVSVDLGPDVRGGLQGVIAGLKQTGAHARWVPSDNLHLSLVFLGDTPGERVAAIVEAIDSVCYAIPPFSFQVLGLGVFGKPKHPRVIWAGVEEISALMHLQRNLSDSLKDLRFKPDQRKYFPHITLGRMKSAEGSAPVQEIVAARQKDEYGVVHVESVALMRSTLDPAGARHALVHRCPL